MTLPPAIEELISKGYSVPRKNIQVDFNLGKRRLLNRKWRNLIGEARFDIPQPLWEYVDWTMPVSWHELKDFYKIKSHAFVIRVPHILPLSVWYQEYARGNDWFFSHYDLTTSAGDSLTSKKQEEFLYFLHMCYELVKPHRRDVIIESLPCKELSDGAVQYPMAKRFTMMHGAGNNGANHGQV